MASQQRWLLAHSGFALFLGCPDDPTPGLYSGRFMDFAMKHRIASRNTAATFLKEMLDQKLVRPARASPDRRITLLEPTEIALEYMAKWVHTHLASLDFLDGGKRMAKVAVDMQAVWRMQPVIANRMLNSRILRHPGVTVSLFNSATSGGMVMDHLVSQITSLNPSEHRVLIGEISPKAISSQFMISSTHLKRLLKQAAQIGSVGWAGAPGKSTFWLSHRFVSEYLRYHAEKYAMIDAVSQAALNQSDI
ncbi:hypothetical protein FHT86_002659 [Rhizobium sp. BK313]|jgi:hypothetical protein|uniref:hypothetical protein n=1 Tax=Rhizobium sp. BK313 TaxID=2587081 RepID=UPI0017928AAF|nr:hypothetical protein [Rhizobium sp. BK313]MBB3454360.1 hypothetical protein [Rhizobium sp. BK313]